MGNSLRAQGEGFWKEAEETLMSDGGGSLAAGEKYPGCRLTSECVEEQKTTLDLFFKKSADGKQPWPNLSCSVQSGGRGVSMNSLLCFIFYIH